jgi:hypothetical protein
MEKKTVFERLSAINVNEHVEKKDGLTYLSWAWAWSEVKKACPDASYKIGATEYDEVLGFMCHTTVTIEGETLEMWLPVMDGKNKSMKKYPYEYNTKYGAKLVDAATTFDINKTIMRCLVKNLAMFGLGIYIYAGEDLPEVESANNLVVKDLSPAVKLDVSGNVGMATQQPAKPLTVTKSEDLPWLNKNNPNYSIIVQQLKSKVKTMAQLRSEYKLSKDINAELTALIN